MLAVCHACQFFLPDIRGHHVLVRSDSSSEMLGSLWQSSSRPLHLQRQLSLPNLFHKELGCPGPRVAQSSALCSSSNCSATTGTQASQGTTAQAYSNTPPPPPFWRNQPLVSELFQLPQQPHGRSPWDGTSSLKQTARYDIHDPSYWPCMCGCSTGAFRPPRACPKHDGRS